MICNVCGTTVKSNEKCPVCGIQPIEIMEGLPETIVQNMNLMISNYRTLHVGSVKIYLRAYFWEEVNGELKENRREDILIGSNLSNLGTDEVMWSDVIFAKQTTGEKKEIELVIENSQSKKICKTSIIAPGTEGTWKVGIVGKPGFRFVVRVGEEGCYSDSEILSLR